MGSQSERAIARSERVIALCRARAERPVPVRESFVEFLAFQDHRKSVTREYG
jgi:hypothetical protein